MQDEFVVFSEKNPKQTQPKNSAEKQKVKLIIPAALRKKQC